MREKGKEESMAPSVLIVDLPEQEDETFRLNRYGIHALRRAPNNGLVFQYFRPEYK